MSDKIHFDHVSVANPDRTKVLARYEDLTIAFCGAQRTPMRFRADVVRNITDALKHLLL